ncbi:MAG: carbonic anhydrase [Burkholderiaceae bacterium]
MNAIEEMLDFNRRWAADKKAQDPEFFTRHAAGQKPSVLLVGCSDSRVPITNITGADPGEMFVYRNIANQMHGADLGAQSVLAYAVDALDVQHILVTGHTNCGGVAAAMGEPNHGLVDHWLANVRLLYLRYRTPMGALPDDRARLAQLVRLNVVLQIYQLTLNPTVRDAWKQGRRLMLHGMVYDIMTGLLDSVVTGVDGLSSAREKLAEFRAD